MKYFIILLLLFVLLFACDDKPNEPEPFSMEYPLDIGHHWEYDGLFHFTDSIADSIKQYVIDSIYYYSTVDVIGLDTLNDSVEVVVVREEQTNSYDRCGDNRCVYTADNYFKNFDDGLYLFGYDGIIPTPMSPLKTNPQAGIEWNGKQYNSITELLRFVQGTIPNSTAKPGYLEPIPLKCLDYEFKSGKLWPYRSDSTSFIIDKKYNGTELITLGPAKYTCAVIEWIYENEDISIFDYYSAIGLIRRHITIDNLVISTYEQAAVDTVSGEYDMMIMLLFPIE